MNSIVAGYISPYFYIDKYYIIFILPAMLIALWAQVNVKSTFNRYSSIRNARSITAAQVARKILDSNGLYNVTVVPTSGNLTDNYNPKNRTVNLSQDVFSSTSVAAIGVAAHECGHAIQHSKAYKPLVLRNSIVPFTQFSSSVSIWLLLAGFLFNWGTLVLVGIILFSVAVFFQLVTLPVEFNASSRALSILESNDILYGDELKGARKVLKAAALTYVAATIVAFAQLFRLLAIFARNRD
jgi:Zn-dependent membrane protease YugP